MTYAKDQKKAYEKIKKKGDSIVVLRKATGAYNALNDSFSVINASLESDLTAEGNTISYANPSDSFPLSGIIKIGDEQIYYLTRTMDNFSSLSRGFDLESCEASNGTSHIQGSNIYLEYESYSTYSIAKSIDDKLIDNNRIKEGDKLLIIPSYGLSIEILIDDYIIYDNKVHTIENVSKLKPGNTIILYKVRIRG